MKKIYFFDEQGKKVTVTVTDEVAECYRDSLQSEWRNDAYERYHSISLDKLIDAGHEFEGTSEDPEKLFEKRLLVDEQVAILSKLSASVLQLTELQKKTIHKLFVRNMTQAEIAKEEGVSEQAISDRVLRMYAKLRKKIEKK